MAAKAFGESDVSRPDSEFPTIYADRKELIYDPPDWMRRGLQETASGYGKRLNSGYKIHYMGRQYRIYVTCFSNNGSCWFTVKAKKIWVE